MPPIPLQTPSAGSIRKVNPSVDAQTERMLMKSMALDPNLRYKSAAEFEQALIRRLDAPYVDPTDRATPPPPVEPAASATSTATVPASRLQPQPATPPIEVQPPAEGSVTCIRCGRVNKPGARFCAGCGAPISLPVARLLVTSPRGSWEQKLERMPLRIGRRDPRQNHYPELDLAKHDRGIASRNHAVIVRDGDYYTLTDLGSTNGTLLNGALVPQRKPQRLNQGDRIKVGEVEMEFRYA
jgi:hypothetical protein